MKSECNDFEKEIEVDLKNDCAQKNNFFMIEDHNTKFNERLDKNMESPHKDQSINNIIVNRVQKENYLLEQIKELQDLNMLLSSNLNPESPGHSDSLGIKYKNEVFNQNSNSFNIARKKKEFLELKSNSLNLNRFKSHIGLILDKVEGRTKHASCKKLVKIPLKSNN